MFSASNQDNTLGFSAVPFWGGGGEHNLLIVLGGEGVGRTHYVGLSLMNHDIIKSIVIEHYSWSMYRIAGKFGEVFKLANWRVCGKSPNIAILHYAYAIGIGRRQI